MKKLLLLSTILCLIGCKKSVSEKINLNDVKTFIDTEIEKHNPGSKIEDIKLIKVDTVSLKDQYLFLFDNMLIQSQKVHSELDVVIGNAKRNKRLIQLSADLWKYDRGTLHDIYMDDYKSELEESKKLLIQDSLLMIDIDNIGDMAKKSDSITPVFYSAKFFVSSKRNDKTIAKDTMYVALDINSKIISNEEVKKLSKLLYKPHSTFYKEW